MDSSRIRTESAHAHQIRLLLMVYAFVFPENISFMILLEMLNLMRTDGSNASSHQPAQSQESSSHLSFMTQRRVSMMLTVSVMTNWIESISNHSRSNPWKENASVPKSGSERMMAHAVADQTRLMMEPNASAHSSSLSKTVSVNVRMSETRFPTQ